MEKINFEKFNWTKNPTTDQLYDDFDRLDLFVAAKLLPNSVKEYGDKPYEWVRLFMDKIEEGETETIDEVIEEDDDDFPRKNRRLGRKFNKTAKFYRPKRQLELRKIKAHKNDENSERNRRHDRHFGKKVCRNYMPDNPLAMHYMPFLDDLDK